MATITSAELDKELLMFGSQTAIYYNAYSIQFSEIWEKIDSKIKETVLDWAYKRAMSCFYRTGQEAIEQRRLLMQSYMDNSGFSRNKNTDLLALWKQTLPTDNSLVRKTINNLTTAYQYPPERTIEDEKYSVIVLEILDKINLNSYMKNIYRIGKLCGEVLVRPVIKGNKEQLIIYYPDEYRAITDGNGLIKEIFIAFLNFDYDISTNRWNEKWYYEHWTDELYEVVNDKMESQPFTYTINKFDTTLGIWKESTKEERQIKHGYGQIPFACLKFDITGHGSNNNDYYELVMSQLELNVISLLSRENIVKTLSLWFGVNLKDLDISTFTGSHGSLINATHDNPDAPRPSIEVVSIPESYNQMAEYSEIKKAQIYKDMGLPTSYVTDSTNAAQSGTAMKLDRIELDEIRRDDLPTLESFENELINLILVVFNKDGINKYANKLNKSVEVKIKYVDMSYYTQEEEMLLIEERRKNGTITVTDWAKFYTEKDMNKEEAIKYINDNLNDFKLIKGVGDGLTNSEDTEPGRGYEPSDGSDGKQQNTNQTTADAGTIRTDGITVE